MPSITFLRTQQDVVDALAELKNVERKQQPSTAHVVVKDFDMTFGNLIVFFLKATIAAIPASIILFILKVIIGAISAGIPEHAK